MIKAILFDFDGVLTIEKTGSETIIRYLAQKTGIAEELLKQEYYKYNKRLLYGALTHEEMWEEFCGNVGYKIEYELLRQSFLQTTLDKEMLDIVESVKENYLTGLITDNKEDRMNVIFDYYDLRRLFDVVSVSAKYKSGKAERRIFDETLNALKVKPEECVFIDNYEKNLYVPREMGFHTILFDDEKRDMENFQQVLGNIITLNK